MTLQELKENWVDEPNHHKMIHETFIENVNSCEWLKEHRDFVEQNAFGFGERSFHWFWKLLVDEMPKEFEFLEIGIFRGQSLSLIELLAIKANKVVYRWGISPLDSTDGHWSSDYKADIKRIHDEFNIEESYEIYEGLSTDNRFVQCANDTSPYDIIYLDGGHTFDVVTLDFKNYPCMTKVGGYFIVDDAACKLNMHFGFFQGIAPVCDALENWLQTDFAKNFEFQFNIVHIMVYKRIS